MRQYLKQKDETKVSRKEEGAGEYWKLRFSAIEKDIPELANRVLLFRSRVKELALHFEMDGKRALNYFHWVTGLTVCAGVLILAKGIDLASNSPVNSAKTGPIIIVLMGGIAALLAAGASSLGLHQRYSALFAGKWAMKALETNIDQIVFDMASEASGRKQLTPAEIKRLRAYIDGWLVSYTTALMSFGDKYGSSFRPVALPDIEVPGK